ncbi:MAG: radical SAM protein, partial [Planctomycetes bacterium]|nr:radical SAM protein [Planctomycetota bacterium]
LIILGDGEEAFPAVVAAYRELKKSKHTRRELVLEITRRFDFVYAPRFYHCEYNDDGTLKSFVPTESGLAECVRRAYVEDMDSAVFPVAPIVPYTETVHDRIAIEIMRGCPQRCAFCLSGHTKGKVRTRSIDTILDIAWQSYLNTGHDTVSLLSLSSSDYPDLGELISRLYEKFENKRVGISLPSLRIDKQLHEVPAQITGVRREGLTLAV